MAITVRIPQPLQKLTGGEAEVKAEGGTVLEIVADLQAQFTGIGERLLDEEGKIRRFVNLYLNDEDVRFLSGLETKIKDGDTLSIVPAIAGGIEPGDEGNLKKKFYLTFPPEQIQRPIIWELIQKHDVIPNIRTASVSQEVGLIAVEIEGTADAIAGARCWLEESGITVEPVEKNVIE